MTWIIWINNTINYKFFIKNIFSFNSWFNKYENILTWIFKENPFDKLLLKSLFGFLFFFYLYKFPKLIICKFAFTNKEVFLKNFISLWIKRKNLLNKSYLKLVLLKLMTLKYFHNLKLIYLINLNYFIYLALIFLIFLLKKVIFCLKN